MAICPVYAPGTSQNYIDEMESKLEVLGIGGGPGGTDAFNLQGSRWTNPAGGPSPNVGDPATITWSIVPDGTQVTNLAGNAASSNLVAFLDGIYGGGSGPIANRPWFNIIQRAYDSWSAESGLNFIYEPNDDGSAYNNANRGVRGVRGDVRLGGTNLDGDFNVLAFNYYPTGSGNSGTDGDMVIDTSDRFFRDSSNGATGENRGFFNVLMHEAGHGIGLGHTIPINDTKLMEPTASFAFLGAQYDDVLGAQTLYGDNDEPNDTISNATDLGTLGNGATVLNRKSVDRNADVDLYKFTIDSAGLISINLAPDGRQYNVGNQGGTASPVNTFLNKDLSFQIEQSDGRVLTTVAAAAVGLSESITNFPLPSGGTYIVRILGAGSETQPYSLRMTLSGITGGGGASTPKAPRLLSVAANSGENFSTTRANSLNESPRELTFRFDVSLDPKTLANGIKIKRAGGDGAFGSSSAAADIAVTPAFLNFGENARIVVARFSQPLPDDLYRIEVFGVDLPSESATAIRDLEGDALLPRRAGTDRDVFEFDLELGTKIIAVVPQPVDRVNGALVQRGRDVEIYFNDSELFNDRVTTGDLSPNPTVVDPQYYNLILTKDTISPNDDLVFNPVSITYDPLLKKATLTFANEVHLLPGVNGAGTFRLRVGSSEAVASLSNNSVVNTLNPADPSGFLTGALDLGSLNNTVSTVVNQEVRTVSNPLLADYPGSNFEPGHRDIQDENHLGLGPDTTPSTTTVFYSFMDNQSYGTDIAGRPLFTSISPEQRQRVREIFEFYSAQLGIDIVEFLGTSTTGDGVKKIVVGDMAPNGAVSGPLDVLGVAQLGGELAIMDGAETWDNSFGYGSNIPGSQSFFETALHEIGHLLGLGHTYDLPPGTIQGSNSLLGRANNPLEQIFPGDADVIHGQHLYRPDNRDVDLYKFTVAPGARGELRAETIAERLNDSSTLDTYLTLIRKNADGTLTIVAANNNYFSDDSLVRADLGPGEYYLSVTGKGNEDNDPNVLNSGSGAVSQGRYQLRIDFKNSVANHISEEVKGSSARGSRLDGDGDGVAGGNFDFWFRAAAPNTAVNPPAVRTLFVDKAFTGVSQNGSLATPYSRVDSAILASRTGDIIRLVGDTRTPTNLTDDAAFEIGNGGASGGALSDGATLEVPRGVTLMIDAGAILKFGGSKIAVGSSDSTSDRSGAAIQVLGIPGTPVYFTSYNDETLGRDTNPLVTTATPGNWGGIEIRNDFDRAQGRADREREGIFLNTISNADMRWGGGLVGVGSLARVVNPIDLSESRPLIIGNTITRSSDSAISADPNSLEETLFTETRYQAAGAFTPDYARVGPTIYSNNLQNNSINGLFVRIDTQAGQSLQTLSVPGRINDSEITIVLGENLIVEGTPGGPYLEVNAPDVSRLTLAGTTPTAGAGFPATISTNYLITYVDRFGQESLPSTSKSLIVNAGQAVRLTNLPAATLDYVSRKVWRQDNNAGAYKLVALLNRDDTTFVDNGSTINGVLQTQGLGFIQRARRDASLVVDPGVVIKSLGGRIELGVSATMLAEGTTTKPIVFTSRLDDRYGAGGSFDTNNDGSATAPAAGDWAGLVSRHLGELSIDHALITFGGGNSRVPGGFASFNAIEVHQSVARIANSIIEENDSGVRSPGLTNRDARGVNDAAAIFVVGSQPVLINNAIRNNFATNTAAISIDANSLNSDKIRDYGRSTGLNERESIGIGNQGPLVNNNRLGGNSLNGMRIRGATLTTESVWDDTDIVHILQSEIVIPDFHTYGGLRLTSKADESLVVKLNNGGGFTALGRPSDITDRIGGSLQILGSQGFPVVLTALSDDTIGAGFDFSGQSLLDTDGNGNSSGTPGAWRSIRIEPYSNDRNVDFNYERESDQLASDGVNDLPSKAQDLGALANSLSGGDENLRLGFTVTGSIASQSDIDTYRFVGTAGTMVWFDIDQTSGSLDSVIELIDANGQIIALSNNSIDESTAGSVFADNVLVPTIRAFPLDQRANIETNAANGTPIDFLGVNPLDAGLRVVLPGVAGSVNNYFLRVRSSNVTPAIANSGAAAALARLRDPAQVRNGISVGEYKLGIRLSQTDEVAGSTIRFADIRYASIGIDAQGQPLHSQLVGELAEANPNETSSAFNAQLVGNIFSTDRAASTIAGRFVGNDFIDYYRFTARRDSIQTVSSTPTSHVSVVFDLDYADGQGRANTQLWIFDSTGRLVMTADDSNIQDDQPATGKGSDVTDLTRGSQGARDAYIGPIELPQGDYFVAVSNKSRSHVAIRQFTDADGGGSTTIRMEPIDSVQRIAEDRFDNRNPLIAPFRPSTAEAPIQVAFDATSNVPFNFSDITMFVANGRNVSFVNPLTGTRLATYSTNGTQVVNFGPNGNSLTDLAVSPGGLGVGFQNNTGVTQDSNSGTFVAVDIGNGAAAVSNSGITTNLTRTVTPVANPPTFETIQVPNNGGNNGIGMLFDGLTFSHLFGSANTTDNAAQDPSFWGVARRGSQAPFQQPILGGQNQDQANGLFGIGITKNILYRLNSIADGNVGQARSPGGGAVGVSTRNGAQVGLGAGTNIVESGYFVRTAGTGGGLTPISGWTDANGTVRGLASPFGSNRLYAVTDAGELMSLIPQANGGQVWSDQYTVINDANGQPIQFTALTAGPRNLIEGGINYSQLLFGTTATGRMYAFNTAGVLQNIFVNGSNFVDNAAGFGSPTGIYFSSNDTNLWHISRRNSAEAGHGRPQVFNNSSDAQTGENLSFRFGYADPRANELTQAGTYTGIYRVPSLYNTIAAPGGAKGALESNLIDLSEYSADDQPYLYFNYRLNTQDANSAIGLNTDVNAALDSMRVYAAGEDGNWILLATNNAPSVNSSGTVNRKGFEQQIFDQGADEFDVAYSKNIDAFGRPRITSELFDNSNWRQARASLAALAGKRDVRIRFEFNTGGDFGSLTASLLPDATRGGIELTAVPGERFQDGGTDLVTSANANRFIFNGTTFEFDLGLVLNLPSGRSIQTGDQIKIGTNFFTFSNAAGATNIPFAVTDSPEAVAANVSNVLIANGYTVATSTLTPNVLNVTHRNNVRLPNAAAVADYDILGADKAIIIGEPGVQAGSTPVFITNAMTAAQVRDAIRTSLAGRLNVAGQTNNLDVWRFRGNTILLHNATQATIQDQSPLILSNGRIGDTFGPMDATNPELTGAFTTQNNNVEGVQLDDIIIGFAERGETIFNAAAGQNFLDTPFYEPVLAAGTLPQEEVETGTYQLEIRAGADYGANRQGDPRLYFYDPASFNQVGRSIGTNERLSKSYALVFNSASQIADGSTFTLSDGARTATFEFDVVNSNSDRAAGVLPSSIGITIQPNASAVEIARAIRNAINSSTAQAIIKITAQNGGDMILGTDLTGPRSLVIQLNGQASADDVGGIGFSNGGVPLTFIQFGQETNFGEDLGDNNANRDQGQFIVASSSITYSSGYGINLDAAAQSQTGVSAFVGDRPYPGAVRSLVTLNGANLAPGAVVMNNVVAFNGLGGINVSGDASTANGAPPLTIARIVNNTLYGRRSSDFGINVGDGASPTILNNIVANFQTGINVVGNASITGSVLGGNLYQDNSANVNPANVGASESFPFSLTSSQPLFIDGTNGYFYLKSLSLAIDSSIASLENRSNIEQVKSAVGLPTSPIIAPAFDVNGLRRSDDPAVNTPAGLGQNVFIDRGAIDRVDFAGPIAVLQRPQDNDSTGVDRDGSNTYVQLRSGNLDFFEILLDEQTGTGTDPRTIVSGNAVILTENGRTLVQGVDYVFGFSANSRTIRLTPLAGFWRQDSVYEVTLINKPTFRLDVPNGNLLSDGNKINVTTSNGAPATLEYDSGYVLTVPQTITLTVPSAGSFASGITDGQTFQISFNTTTVTFEFDTNGSVATGNTAIPIVADRSATQVRDAILQVLNGVASLNLAVAPVGTNSIHLGTVAGHAVDVSTSLLTKAGIANGIADGQRFVYDSVSGPAVTFEFNVAGDSVFGSGNTIITFNRQDTHLQLAAKIAAVANSVLPKGFAPIQDIGGGSVYFGGQVGDLFDVSLSSLSVGGAPGVTGAYKLTVPAGGGSAINDGTTFSIRNSAGQTFTFEFDKNSSVNSANRGIAIRDTDNATQIATVIASSIAATPGLGLNPSTASAVITLNEPRGTLVNVGTSPLVLSGVSGGAIAIPFVPSASFTNGYVAPQLLKAFSQLGLGTKAYALGYTTLLVEGLSSVLGTASLRIDPPISDLAANWLQPNRANSLTQFTILMPEVRVDFGDAIERAGTGAISNTTLQANGARHGLYPDDVPALVLGQYADSEFDGVPSAAADSDDFSSSVAISAGLPLSVAPNGPARLSVSAPAPGMLGRTIVITDVVNKTVTYQFTDNTQPPVPNGVVPVDLTGVTTANVAAARLQAAVLSSILAGDITGIHAIVSGNVVSLGGTSGHIFDLSASGGFVQRVSAGSLGLSVPADISSLAQGQTLSIADGSGNQVIFQIIDSAAPISLAAGNTALVINLATATQSSFATAVLQAINTAISSGKLRLPQASLSNNTIRVTADDEDGVTFAGLFNSQTPPVQTTIVSTDSGYMDAWIDWNQDNDFDDANEQILKSEPVAAGANTFSIVTPSGTLPGFTTARFRLSATGGLFTYGLAVGGEVEDYVIEILPGSPPVAVDDPSAGNASKYRVNEDAVLTVSAADGVLANDSDADSPTFTVFDFDPNTAGVQPTVAPANGKLVLQLDGSFVYTPNADFFGTDTFVYQVTDPRMVGNRPATVTITVSPINDTPRANADAITINEDAAQVWNGNLFTANDFGGVSSGGTAIQNEANQTLRVIGIQLIDSTGASITPRVGESISLANNVISYTPGSNYNSLIGGNVFVRLQIEDNGVTYSSSSNSNVADPKQSTSTLTITINPVNDRPVFTIPNSTLNLQEDPGSQTLPNFVTNVFAGPTADTPNGIGPADDELGNVSGVPGQSVTFTVRALDPTRFTSAGQPAIARNGTNGTLTFTLAPDVNSTNSGPILVEVIADDGNGGGQSIPRTVTINVAQVNDAPSFALSTNSVTISEDAPRTAVPSLIVNALPGPSTAVDESAQKFTVSVAAVNPQYFSLLPRMTGTGDLEFQLMPDVNSLFAGSLDILVTLTDDGTPNASATRTLTIVANDVNDSPSFTLNSSSVVVREDETSLTGVSPISVPNFATNLLQGPLTALDELGQFAPTVPAQSLTFTLISMSNPTMFSQAPAIDSSGTLSFVTAPDRNGTAVVVMRLTDNGRASPTPNSNVGPTATFTITVNPINDSPEFTIPSSTTVDEDQGVVSLTGFASGIRPGPATAIDEANQSFNFIVRAEDPSIFSVLPTIQNDGTLVFQTAPNVNNNTAGILRRVFVSLRDNGVGSPAPNSNISAEQTFTINIRPVNDPPVPDPAIFQGVEDQSLNIIASDVLQGDLSGPPDETSAQLRMSQIERTTDRGGTVVPVFSPSGDRIISFLYTPPTNLAGQDFIRYVVTDDGTPPASATGTVTIQLAAINDAPQFVAGSDVAVPEDTVNYSSPWATDILAGPPSAQDENSGPTAQTVNFILVADNPSLFSVQPEINSSGVLTFSLAKDAIGRAIIDVTAIDSGSSVAPNVNRSGTSKLTININPVNDAPGFIVVGDVTVDEDSNRYSAVAIRNIVPAEGMNSSPPTGSDESSQSVILFTSNNNSQLFSVQPTISSAGILEFVPAQDAFGTAIVSVFARDNGPSTAPNVNQSSSQTFTIVVRPVNDVPVAVNDTYSTGEDSVLSVTAPGVISNDRDVDLPNDQLSVDTFQSTSALGAVVSMLPNGSLVYDPTSATKVQALVTGQTGQDTFTYTLKDSAGFRSIATVTISVAGANDNPIAVDDSYSVPIGVNPLLPVLENDRDVDNTIDPRTVEIGQLAANGTALALSTGRIEYRPNPGFRGRDSFTYRVRDALGALSNEARVDILVNTAPVTVADSALTGINTPVVVNVLRNDSDPDGTLDVTSVTVVTGPDVGSTTVLPDGTIRYVPPTDFFGTANFQYIVLDDNGLSSVPTSVQVRVTNSIHQNPVNNLDVNADGFISPIDALIVINDLNINGARVLPLDLPTPPYLDVNGNRSIDPLDVLSIINFINARGSSGAGEGEGTDMASLGYFQDEVVMVPTSEVVRLTNEFEESLRVANEIDSFVASSSSGSVYGPALPGLMDDEDEDDLVDSLVSLDSGSQSTNDFDSAFSADNWL